MRRHRRNGQWGKRRRTAASRPSLEVLDAKQLLAVFTVTSVADPAQQTAGTLRDAIIRANQSPGRDTIRFDIRNVFPRIVLTRDLPDITDTLLIDGTSQPKPGPGSSTYQGPGEIVQIDGNNSTSRAFVLSSLANSTSSGSEIRGLAFTQFVGDVLTIQPTSNNNFIHRNRFGLDLTQPDPQPLPNGGNNIFLPSVPLLGVSTNNKFGTNTNRQPSANIIANGGGSGILIEAGRDNGNSIRYSPIYGNTGLGIDLRGSADPPVPIITSAERVDLVGRPPRTEVSGRMTGLTPGSRYLIDLFVSPTAAPFGSSQGQEFVATVSVEADASGVATFDRVQVERADGQPILDGEYITATATSQADVDDLVGITTSEISGPQIVTLFTNRVDLEVSAYARLTSTTGIPNPPLTSVRVGEPFSYVVSLTNRNFSGFSANDATLSMVLPDHLIVDPTRIQLPFGASPPEFRGNQIIVNLGTLPSFVTRTVVLDGVVATAEGAVYSQFQTITRDVVDPDLSNDFAGVEFAANLDPVTPIVRFQSMRAGVSESGNEAIFFVDLANNVNLTNPVTVQYATSDGTGIAGIDYVQTQGTITFNPGEFATKRIVVPILGNDIFQPDRTVNLSLTTIPTGAPYSPSDVAIGAPRRTVLTIFDDDPEPEETQILEFSSASFSVEENQGVANVRVSRTGSTAGRVTVNYSTTNGTAIGGIDFTPVSGTLVFNSGEDFKDIPVPLLDNAALDGNRSFEVMLSGSVGAVIGSQGTAEVTIIDDESPPAGFFQFSSATYQVVETAGLVTIAVTRQGGVGAASISYSTTMGTAVPGVRYTPVSGVIDFGPTDVSRTFSIPINDTTVFEGTQTVGLSLQASGGAVLGSPATATLSILDDETPPAAVVQFAQATFSTPENGGVATVTLTRMGGLAGAATVRLTTSGGTATPGADFTPVDRILTFAEGQTSLTVDIPLVNDVLIEPDETVGLILSSPGTGVVLGVQATATLVIQNDDLDLVPPRISTLGFGSVPAGSINSLILTFSEPMAAAAALSTANYSIVSLGRDGLPGTGDDRVIRVADLGLDPSGQVLTLTLGAGIPLGQFAQLVVNGGSGGLTDVAGNLIDGDLNGQPGGNYLATFARGTNLRYRDADGDQVSLGLRHGGLLELIRDGQGEAQLVRVVNPAPFRSILAGAVRRLSGRGNTTIQRISGVGQFGEVRIALRTPPFYVGEVTDSAGVQVSRVTPQIIRRRPIRF